MQSAKKPKAGSRPSLARPQHTHTNPLRAPASPKRGSVVPSRDLQAGSLRLRPLRLPRGPSPHFQPRRRRSADPSLASSSPLCASARLPTRIGPIKLFAEVPPPRGRPRTAAATHLLAASAERRPDADLRAPFPPTSHLQAQPRGSLWWRRGGPSEIRCFGLSPPSSARFECPASAPAPARG